MQNITLEKPTKRWQESMQEGDDIFTDENIKATEKVLDEFIKELSELKEQPTEEEILAIAEKVVKVLNDLNSQYYHIDTVEREELCDFILQGVRQVGFTGDDDFTYEWREW